MKQHVFTKNPVAKQAKSADRAGSSSKSKSAANASVPQAIQSSEPAPVTYDAALPIFSNNSVPNALTASNPQASGRSASGMVMSSQGAHDVSQDMQLDDLDPFSQSVVVQKAGARRLDMSGQRRLEQSGQSLEQFSAKSAKSAKPSAKSAKSSSQQRGK